MLFFFLLALAASASAQTASLSGRVLDSSLAAVQGALVEVKSLATQTKLTTQTNAEGFFLLPTLNPGAYSITITADGFATATMERALLEVGQVRTVEFKLQPRAVAETIQVTDASPLLESARADRGAVVESSFVLSIPLNIRNPLQLVNFTPGVTGGGLSGVYGAAGTNTVSQTQTNSWRINGGKANTNEIQLDGATNIQAYANQAAAVPQVDAVQEFRVHTSPYAPEFGRTSGGVISFAMRSGTSQLHGTAHEFLRNSVLDANGFNANRALRPRQKLQRNQFGGTLGGPVWIPKIYNGANKTFFFFAYEGLRESAASSFTGSVPTAAERVGNFSQSRDVNGALILIYNPRSTRLDPTAPPGTTRFIRDLYPGNILPANELNQVGVNLLRFFPEPNQAGRGQSNIDNFFSGDPSRSDQNRVDIKVNHQLSERHALMARWNWFKNFTRNPSAYNNEASPNSTRQQLPGINGMLQHTWILNSVNILEHHFAYGFSQSLRVSTGVGFDPVTLGMAPNTFTGLRDKIFPGVTMTRLSNLGGLARNDSQSEFFQYRANVTMVRGAHTFKTGFDFRHFPVTFAVTNPVSIAATFNFTGGPNPAAPAAASGHGAADLLLGAAQVTGNIVPAEVNSRLYYGLFFQDEWRLSRRLTLTYGLRYNLETPAVEEKNAYVFLDLESPSPIASRVPAIPNLRGGLGFPGIEGRGRRVQQVDRNNLDPRLGLAFSWNDKTVIRSGFGIFHHPTVPLLEVSQGFSLRSSSLHTEPNGFTPLFNLAQPFPNGLPQPMGNSLGLATLLGQNINAVMRNQQISYNIHWSLDVQRELPAQFLLNVGYAGTSGVELPSPVNFNQLPDAALAQGPALLQAVPNPFFGVITDPTSPLSRPTVQRGQLLRPFPHFLNVIANGVGAGHSTYHALQLSLQRRFTNGLAFLLAYTRSKMIDNVGEVSLVGGDVTGFQNNNCYSCDRSLSFQDTPDVLRLSLRYDLPFGKGRRYWNRGWAANIFGGWSASSFWLFDTGLPVRVTSPNDSNSFGGGGVFRPNATGRRAGGVARNFTDGAPYFNADAFSRTPPFSFGNVSRNLPDVRQPGQNIWNLMIEKAFFLTEQLALDFRTEMFNAFNTVHFAGPATNIATQDFGRIFLRQLNPPRQIQFGARLRF
ncbi:MAG: carboxypeptidase-like regulatory domain-containing protein [Bryobacteraceae bacterium]|nr:carboxypeptidase-like regulatory domain-containing protein [Bryobacteraceae bacterium]MDW8377825.1 carboxypeptidase-like regulatory domain-containing protein [Bryobacterales bacterium]